MAATFKSKMAATFMALALLICINNCVKSSQIESKIYRGIKSYSPCILLTNATHQVGCTSNMGGNRGILHVVESDDDVDWLIDKGPNQPYIPLLNSTFFNENVMNKLMNSKKISGVLVVHKATTTLPPKGQAFSPDSKCPLDQFGAYTNDKENGNCQKIKWNPFGNDMSKKYYGIPIFALSDEEEINELVKCYKEHNKPTETGETPNFPLCAVEMKDFMFASKDTPTCRRKTEMPNPIQSTYCDPLGDNNIYGSLFPIVDEVENDEVVMAATRLDSTAFFHDFAHGADNGVTGIVTLLAAAHALGDYKRYIIGQNITEKLKPIVFTFFNGEVWDYIGSSKMVYDMERDNFPYSSKKVNTNKNNSDETWTSKFNLKSIGYFMEITQVGLSEKIYAHTDLVSSKDNITLTKIDEMLKFTKESFEDAFMPFDVVDRSLKQPLPPASFQRFLRSYKKIPGVVLADHDKEFINKYYNSRFDTSDNVGFYVKSINNVSYLKMHGPLVKRLSNLSEAVANSLYLLASGGKPPKQRIVVPANLTANLLYCLMISANCPSYKEVLGKKSNPLPNAPMSRYISVLQIDNPITQVIHRLLSYYTGEWLEESQCEKKVKTSLPYAFSYFAVAGRGSMVCVRSTTYMTPAVSPAFELQDYHSTEYSTWAESMWNSDIGLKIYLVASPSSEIGVLFSGIIIFAISFALVYLINRKAEVLFTPSPSM